MSDTEPGVPDGGPGPPGGALVWWGPEGLFLLSRWTLWEDEQLADQPAGVRLPARIIHAASAAQRPIDFGDVMMEEG